MDPKVYINHIGFLCNANKKVIVDACNAHEFRIQDMNVIVDEKMGEAENWKCVFLGKLSPVQTHMGNYLIGDFSDFKTPGVYRIIVPGVSIHSNQFIITNGAFSQLPRLFLDHIHNWRSGDIRNPWRGPSNLDDGVRSDTGKQIDVSGGWYDAGDLRKWMVHTNLPALGFVCIHMFFLPGIKTRDKI